MIGGRATFYHNGKAAVTLSRFAPNRHLRQILLRPAFHDPLDQRVRERFVEGKPKIPFFARIA